MNCLELIQKENLRLFVAFDKFCREKKLTYYMIGGTLLGAVRHKGFIPWDDDIDIGIPRNDYNRLREMRLDIDGAELKSHLNDREYMYPYMKLYSLKNTLVEYGWRPYVAGTYIDIFPMDGVPGGVETHCNNLARWRRRWDSRIKPLSMSNNYFKAAFLRYSSGAVTLSHFLKRMDDFCGSHSGPHVRYLVNSYGIYGSREFTEKSNFDTAVELEFEKGKFLAPGGYERYLTSVYGDFMTLPPENKRVSHHEFCYFDPHIRRDKRIVLAEIARKNVNS